MFRMKIRNKSSVGCWVVVFISVFLTTFCFYGCYAHDIDDNQPPEANETVETDETVKLNLVNYSEYFFLQEEIISYNKEEYIKHLSGWVGGATSNCTMASQITKVSILPLKKNMLFNNVEMTIASANSWQCAYGRLKLSYDGSGSVMITSTFDGETYLFNAMPNAHYRLCEIKGNITLSH